MFQFASSLDTVGVLSRSVEDAAIAVDGMKGLDKNDMTTWDSSDIHLYESLSKDVKGKKLFYIKEICGKDTYKDIKDEVLTKTISDFHNTIDKLKDKGFIIEEVSFDKKLLEAI